MGIRPRLADLAEHAGVSISTASRVVNGKPGIREETRQAVLRAMAELDYSPERLQQHTGIVGLVLPELNNPAFPTFAERLDALFGLTEFRTVIAAAGPLGSNESTCVGTLQDLGVDGIISVSGAAADTQANVEPYVRLQEAGIPTVFINGFTARVTSLFVNCSDSEAVGSSVNHLRSLGHERIGLATGPERFLPSQRKMAAFLAQGLAPDSIELSLFTAEGGRVAGAKLLETGHTAIICGSDLMALGVVREAHARGLRVPEDVSVIGYDDSPMMAYTAPALTTVRQPVQAMCEAAVTGLRRAIEGNQLDGTELSFHPDLIIRNSTGPRA